MQGLAKLILNDSPEVAQHKNSNADFDIKFVEISVFKDLLDDSFMNKHTCNGTKKLTTQQWVTVLETTLYSLTKK